MAAVAAQGKARQGLSADRQQFGPASGRFAGASGGPKPGLILQ